MTEPTIKQSKRVKAAIEAYDVWKLGRLRYRTHTKITNSPLPPHKQPLHNLLLARCMVKFKNAAAAFDAIYKKMNNGEKIQFAQLMEGKQ